MMAPLIQILVTLAFCLCTFGGGSILLLWPEKIQKHALKHGTKFYFWRNPFLGWMQTRSYLIYLRVMGAVFMAAGLFVLIVVLTNLHQ
jgi:hypothetical protein